MDFSEAISRLEKFSKAVNRAIIGLAVLDAIFVIIIGVASSYLDTDDTTTNKFTLWILLGTSLLYLLLLLIRTIYNANYPGSISNELRSERELFNLKRNSDRQNTISDFLITTIEKLNGQTCALNYGDDTHLCDIDIQQGIFDLIEPVIENMHFILDTNKTKFTIGIYLNSYRSMEDLEEWESGIIVISDKLEKGELLVKDLLNINEVKGEQFQLQTAIRQAFNEYKFVVLNYTSDGEHTIICSPMPFACDENDVSGVLFIVAHNLDSIPSETETTLKIFNRVITNWVYRYNECIYGRQERIKKETEIMAKKKNNDP